MVSYRAVEIARLVRIVLFAVWGARQRGAHGSVRSKAWGASRMRRRGLSGDWAGGRSRTADPFATRHVGRRCYLTELTALGKTNLVNPRFKSSPSVAPARGFG